jgi:hypothetical protein
MKTLIKVLKWVAGIFVFLVASFAVLYVVTFVNLPPKSVTPGQDLLATGTPSLPFPPGMGESFEPHIAINPNDSNHIVVAAMTGNRLGRGGKDIYRWITRDGGKQWTGAIVPAIVGQGQFAADAVLVFDTQGQDHLVNIAANADLPLDPALDALLTSGLLFFAEVKHRFQGRPVEVSQESREEEETKRTTIQLTTGNPITDDVDKPIAVSAPKTTNDKPWITIDNNPGSKFRGSIYTAWSDLSALVPSENTPELEAKEYISLGVSRDGGKTSEQPVRAVETPGNHDAGFPGMAVRPNGRLDITFNGAMRFESRQAISHVFSDDGGKTFSKIVDIRKPEKGLLAELSALTAAPDGTLLACWNESIEENPVRVKCATTRGDEAWSEPIELDTDISATGKIGMPAVAANDQGLWVLAYKTDTQTDVVLYRSTDSGKSFKPYTVLASRPFGSDKMCIGSVSDYKCRFVQSKFMFSPGDYVGLSAEGNRVAAAFGFPLGNDPVQFATTYVKVLDIPSTVR